jgi:dihydroanticapsin dehydrogenase
MTGRLVGKRIIVTGAGANIGREAVRCFVSEGARMVIGGRDGVAGRRVEAESDNAVAYRYVDVTGEDSVRDFIASAVEWLGGLDVLVQNSGVQYSGLITEFDAAKWDALFAVNARGHFFGAKYAVPHLRKSGKGSIINMSSIAGRRGGPGMTGYSASKGAAIGFSIALAMELAKDNIRVNTICPGWIDTPFNQPAIDAMGGRENQEAIVRQIVPLGRQATSAEIAPLFVYLASDESSYVTAQTLSIDGGIYT